MKKVQMNKDSALLVAGIVFGIVALAHLFRLMFHFNLLIARQMIPVWISFPGFLISLGLCIWMFMARNSKSKRSS